MYVFFAHILNGSLPEEVFPYISLEYIIINFLTTTPIEMVSLFWRSAHTVFLFYS